MSSYKDYREIVKYTGNLNPPEPPFPHPPDLTLNKKWYITIKPMRLLYSWTDVTVGRRLIARHGELRFSFATCSKLRPIGMSKEDEDGLSGWLYGYLQAVNAFSGSLRYYLNTNGRGSFFGIGASHSSFVYTNEFFSEIFSWPALKVPANYDGGLIEIGMANLPSNSVITTFSVCAVVGKLNYLQDGKRIIDDDISIIPSLNWTLGIMF